MTSFAIVAEGITDQIVLERMIEQLCGDEEIEVNFLQPSRDDTDKHRAAFGGWQLVLEYIRDRTEDALVTNDYLIVQIDTDCGEHQDFGLPLTLQGVARDQISLVDDASEILATRVGHSVFAQYSNQILFAVSVHSLESWLLLISHNDQAVMSGFDKLSRIMQRKNDMALAKTAEVYEVLARRIKRKRLLELARQPHSLGVFLGHLIDACSPADKACVEDIGTA